MYVKGHGKIVWNDLKKQETYAVAVRKIKMTRVINIIPEVEES